MQVLDHVASGLKDAAELFEMAREENDDDTLAAVQSDIAGIEKDVSTLEFRRMFNNPADPSNCFVDIRPAPAAPRPATGRRCCCGST